MGVETCLTRFSSDYHLRLNPTTIKLYRYQVTNFLNYTEKPFQVITKKDIWGWLRYMTEREYEPSTIRSNLIGLKKFFTYCREEGFLLENPTKTIPYPSVEEKLPRYLQLEQLVQIRHDLVQHRPIERAIFEVFLSTGMRIGELCAMKQEDIQWSDNVIHIPIGKRKRGRIVLFTKTCEAHLKAYVENRLDENPYVFASPRFPNRAITQGGVQKWFRGYSKRVGFKVTPHRLRYTFAAQLAQKGMPFHFIQALLGHENPEQTRYYARLYHHARKERYDELV